MTATDQNATIYEGEYKKLPFGPVTDLAGATVDLAGATLSWKLYASDGPDGAVLLSKTPTVDSPSTAGTGYVTIATGDTTGMGGQSYYHEMVITKSSQPEVAFIGQITIKKSGIL